MSADRIRLVTWNIHGFVGADGCHDPRRTLDVLQDLDPDLIALQEVDARSRAAGNPHPLDLLASGLRATAIAGPTLGSPGCDYGNAVLSRLDVVDVRRHDVSQPDAEPRSAIDVRVATENGIVRLLAVHLGLRRRERAAQAMRLAAHLEDNSRPKETVVLAGDLNSWWPRAREVRILERAVGPSLKPRTFPSTRPVFRLDRVLVHPRGHIADWGVAIDPRVRIASDHLPVRVDLESS